MQRRQRRPGPLARRRPRHRLHPEDSARGGRRYDLIFQLAGTRSPWDCRRALTPKGTLLVSSGASDGRWIGPIGRIRYLEQGHARGKVVITVP